MLRGLSLVVASRGSSLSCCSAQASHCSGFFSCRARALGRLGFSSCGSWAAGSRFSSCGSQAQLLHSMWDPLRSGTDPMPPALAAKFFTAEPPGKTRAFCWLHSMWDLVPQTGIHCTGSKSRNHSTARKSWQFLLK